MAKFLSFVLCDKGDGLRAYADPRLILLYGVDDMCHLRGYPICEVVWDDNDIIWTSQPDRYFEEWIRQRWSSRQELANELIDAFISEGCMPDISYYSHPRWTDRNKMVYICDCVEHLLERYEEMFPDDMLPRGTINLVRQCVDHKVAHERLKKVGRVFEENTGSMEFGREGLRYCFYEGIIHVLDMCTSDCSESMYRVLVCMQEAAGFGAPQRVSYKEWLGICREEEKWQCEHFRQMLMDNKEKAE